MLTNKDGSVGEEVCVIGVTRIKKCKEMFEAFCHYPGQVTPQSSYIELDGCEVSASYDSEIGGAVTRAVYNGRVRRYVIPHLTGSGCNQLMFELQPLLERVVAGLEEVWDGSNWSGKLSEDAENAEREISEFIRNSIFDDSETVQQWEAHEWVQDDVVSLGITKVTTDDELTKISEEFLSKCDENIILTNLSEYLESLRDELVEDS